LPCQLHTRAAYVCCGWEDLSFSLYMRLCGPQSQSRRSVKKKEIFLERTNGLLSLDTTRTTYKSTRPKILLHCSGDVFTEPLPSNDRGYTNRHRDWWEVFMNCAVEKDSGLMICIPDFIKVIPGIQKLTRGISRLCGLSCSGCQHNKYFKIDQSSLLHWFYLLTATCFGPYFGPSSGSFIKYVSRYWNILIYSSQYM
jgi:hypothetical protein